MNNIYKVTVADLNIELRTVDSLFFLNRVQHYMNPAFTARDLLLQTIACDEIAEPLGTYIEQIRHVSIVITDNNKLCRYERDQATGKLVMATYYNQDHSEVEIYLSKEKNHPLFSFTDFEYIYTGFSFSDRLTELGGVVLHGSSIAVDKQGIVFSANSGIGKSTHSSLWKERYGDDVIVVNDDKPAIRFYDGIPYIFGTPWSGKTDLNTNVRVPLTAIVFIQRAETNRIELLNRRDSIFCLSGQIERPYYDSDIGIKTLDRIEQIVMTVPIYKLHCNISQEAVEVVYNEIIS